MKSFRFCSFILLIWACVGNAYAQKVSYEDSLAWAFNLLEQEKYQEADNILNGIGRAYSQLSPDIQMYYDYAKGCSSSNTGNPKEAVFYLERTKKLMEEHCDTLGAYYYDCMYGLGEAYLDLNDTVNAERSWRHAFVRALTAPREVMLSCNALSYIITSLGDIYNAKGDTLLARDVYFYATQVSLTMLDDSNQEKLSPEVLNNYIAQQNDEGLEFMREGKYTEAIHRFNELIVLCNNNSNEYWPGILFHNLGRTWMLQEEYDKALQCLEKAKEIQISVSGSPMERTITYIKECEARQ